MFFMCFLGGHFFWGRKHKQKLAGQSRENSVYVFSSVPRASKQGGFKRGGFPNLDLSFHCCPLLSFFVPFCLRWAKSRDPNRESLAI